MKLDRFKKSTINLKTKNNDLIPVFVHSHHIHQHEVDEKFGIKRPINIDHIVCF